MIHILFKVTDFVESSMLCDCTVQFIRMWCKYSVLWILKFKYTVYVNISKQKLWPYSTMAIDVTDCMNLRTHTFMLAASTHDTHNSQPQLPYFSKCQ